MEALTCGPYPAGSATGAGGATTLRVTPPGQRRLTIGRPAQIAPDASTTSRQRPQTIRDRISSSWRRSGPRDPQAFRGAIEMEYVAEGTIVPTRPSGSPQVEAALGQPMPREARQRVCSRETAASAWCTKAAHCGSSSSVANSEAIAASSWLAIP